jgi:EAL and modified HD-GYP domain-containing signal transduction protein
MVGLELQNLSDLELILRSGYSLAGGRLGRDGQARNPRPLGPAAHRICELINHLAMDKETALISQAVQGDAMLSYRLLRYANSPAIGLAQPVQAIDAAVTILGRAELGRWLSVMLMASASGRQAAGAIQSQALANGRMFELLARDRGEAAPQVLFTLGLLSQLPLLLELPMQAALEPLRLSESLRQALLQRSGPWAMYLDLAAELEGDDEVAAERSAAPFGGLAVVMQRAETAWDWARGVSGSVGPE